jgi:uncharacterized phage protein gp47/JayE
MPYNYLLTSGTIIPDTSTLKAEVQTEWRSALGQDLSLDDESPQGVLINAEVISRAASAENNAALANQINPDVAGGIYLDSLCALFGLQRIAETRTAITGVDLAGQPQTTIPTGSRARTAAGDVFELVATVQLDSGGLGTGDFRAVEFGPVPAPANDLTFIVDAVLGWETVNNPNAGVIGSDVQSDASLRNLRRRTLARQSMSIGEAVTAAVSDLEGVRSLQMRENTTNAAATIDGILIDAHSLWVCVDGGTNADIAKALLDAKTCGAGWTGAVSVNVVDEFSGQTYPVEFNRPDEINILAKFTVRRGTFVGSIQDAIRDAVMTYADGEFPNEQGFVVGGNVSPFDLSGPVTTLVPGLYVAKVEITSPDLPGPPPYSTDEIVIGLDQVPRITPGSITVIEL